MRTAYVGLGSNLGEREQHLARAIEGLAQIPNTRLVRVSSWIETEPEGGPPGQGRYLNGAARIETELTPRALLEHLLDLERAELRVRVEGVRDGPRTLDLDLLHVDGVVLDEPGLVVPHPRLEERLFVLRPLAEIAPGLRLSSGAAVETRIAFLERRARTLEPRES